MNLCVDVSEGDSLYNGKTHGIGMDDSCRKYAAESRGMIGGGRAHADILTKQKFTVSNGNNEVVGSRQDYFLTVLWPL
ncbi:hypothetical protein SUGI_0044570 [Cryptomeria japonica]|nr:hypothetical protein SUGI_0044570 [Cryptomeria japonica]